MGRNAPDSKKLGSVLSNAIATSQGAPVGSILEMAATADVVGSYVKAEGGYVSKAAWPALANIFPDGYNLTGTKAYSKALPFNSITGVRVINDLFIMSTSIGTYRSPDGLVWDLCFSHDTNYSYTIEKLNGPLVVFGSNGEVHLTNDGMTWTNYTSTKVFSYIDKIGSTYFVGIGSTLYSTTDFQVFTTLASWTYGTISGIYCGTKLCVVYNGAYRLSTDNGATFGAGLSLTSAQPIARKGDGTIVRRDTGTTYGIQYSTDNGETWTYFIPTGATSALASYDYVTVPGKGHFITRSTSNTACVRFNTSPTDPTATYVDFNLQPNGGGPMYFYVEVNSKKILLYGSSTFRPVPIPTGALNTHNAYGATPFVFTNITYPASSNSQGLTISTRKDSTGNFLHTCMASCNFNSTLYTIIFIYKENADSSRFTFFDSAYVGPVWNPSGTTYYTKIGLSFESNGILTTYYTYTVSGSASYAIYSITYNIGSGADPVQASANANTANLNPYTDGIQSMNSINDCVYCSTGSAFMGFDKNGFFNFGLPSGCFTPTNTLSFGDNGVIYYTYSVSSNPVNVYASYDNGRTFSLIFTGAYSPWSNYLTIGVCFFNGYFWGTGGGTPYRARTIAGLNGISQVPFMPSINCNSITTIANGQLLMFTSLGNPGSVWLVDKNDNVAILTGSSNMFGGSRALPTNFFNGKGCCPSWWFYPTAAPLTCFGSTIPDGYLQLPNLIPSAASLHKYIKGA